jgi:hypothetical protein
MMTLQTPRQWAAAHSFASAREYCTHLPQRWWGKATRLGQERRLSPKILSDKPAGVNWRRVGDNWSARVALTTEMDKDNEKAEI